MKVFRQMTLAFLMKNKSRTLVTIIGVILSVAMITSITTFISSLQYNMAQSAKEGYGDWHVQLEGLDEKTLKHIEEDPDVVNMTYKQSGKSIAWETDAGENTAYIHFTQDNFFSALPFHLVDGDYPQNDKEIVIPADLLDYDEFKIGQEVTLPIGYIDEESEDLQFVKEGSATFKVVGVATFPQMYEFANNVFALGTGNATHADALITLHNPKNVYDFAAKYNDYHAEYNKELLLYLGIVSSMAADQAIMGLAVVLIGIIVFGSVLLIYNAFAISVSERTKYFGLLSSIGATKKQLKKMIFFEAVVISALGIPLGLLAGIAGIGMTMKLLSKPLSDLVGNVDHFDIKVSFVSLIIAVILALMTIFISVWRPAQRASKQTAIDSIRQSEDIRIRPKDINGGKKFYEWFGLEAVIAERNFKRNRKKYRTTIISLSVSMVLVVAAGAFTGYLTKGVSEVAEPANYDVVYYTENAEKANELMPELQQFEGMKQVSYTQTVNVEVEAANLADVADIVVYDDATFEAFARQANVTKNGAILINKRYERDFDTGKFYISDQVSTTEPQEATVRFNDRTYKMYVAGYTKTIPMGLSEKLQLSSVANYIISQSYAKQVLGEMEDAPVLYMTMNNVDETVKKLENYLLKNGYSPGNLYNKASEAESDRNLVLIINVFCYGFIVLISLIAVANVFNTISTNIQLRRKEFAILKSVGLGEKAFRKMLRFECLLYGVKSIAWGLPIAFIITFVIHYILNNAVTVGVMIPWTSLVTSMLGIFIVVLLSMWYAVRKTKEESIIDALKNENL